MKFVNRWQKESLLHAIKSRKGLKASSLPNHSGPDCNIFISEHLTPRGEALAAQCRELRREEKIFSTWHTGGKIYVKTNKDGNKIIIKDENDIQTLKEKLN